MTTETLNKLKDLGFKDFTFETIYNLLPMSIESENGDEYFFEIYKFPPTKSGVGYRKHFLDGNDELIDETGENITELIAKIYIYLKNNNLIK